MTYLMLIILCKRILILEQSFSIFLFCWKNCKIKSKMVGKITKTSEEMVGKIAKTINDWLERDNKALLIYGARQVGKTYIIRDYINKSSYNLIEFNFIKEPAVIEALKQSTSSEELVLNLSLLTNKRFEALKTVIFFDEIQEYKEIITKIKFFVEEGKFRFVLSGSLFGVELRNIKSAPVGYLKSFVMYPLDFEEFLQVYNTPKDVISNLRKAFINKTPISDFMHDRLMKIFKQYLIIGGMPQAVQKFSETFDINDVIEEHKNIVNLYKLDFTKYEEENHKLEITKVYDLIPAELNSKNKRFTFKSVADNFVYDRNKDNFLWLTNAGVAIPTFNTNEPLLPLLINEKSSLFKLFLSDVGMLSTAYGKAFKNSLLTNDDFLNFGAIYENLVAQELTSHGFKTYYFSNKKLGEIDFLIEYQNKVLPIEVKSGKDYKKHSALNNLLEVVNYDFDEAFVFSNANISVEGKITYYPIYMIMFLNNEDVDMKIDINKIKF